MTSTNSTQTIPLQFGKTVWHLPHDRDASIRSVLPTVDDLHMEVERALCNPTGFTSIDQMIVSGDKVALAVEARVPSLGSVVCAVARWLLEHGVSLQDLQIVFAGNEQQTSALLESLSENGLAELRLDRHDPDDLNCVSYVAADEDAQAIYVNRVLVDADVVIPISCARPQESIDYLGPFSAFPLFSNRETRGELYNYARLSDCSKRELSINRANQAAWWLGLLVGIQVLPAANGQVSAVLCGLLSSVDEQAQEQLAGRAEHDQIPDLVIACVDDQSPDWLQVAHALHAASICCSQGGTIVLCTEAAEPIGPALRRLKDVQNDCEQMVKRLAKDNSDDSLAAGAILTALKDHHLYLVSKHRSDTVESLGMGVLTGEEQLVHIAHQHARYLIINSAQYA